MNLQQRVNNAVQALTGKTNNSLGVSEANRFLRYGSGQKPLVQNWSDVKMSDEDMYTGYSYAAIVKRANRTSVLGRRFVMTEASQKTVDEYRAREEDLIHPYLKVVNRSKEFTKKQFWYEISTYLDLEGVYYLGVVRNARQRANGTTMVGAVQKFVLINPYEIRRIIKESSGEVGGYVESHNGFYREWAPHEIIEIKMLNPFDKDKPFAMTDAAKESQFTLKQAGDYTRQTLNGNISSPGIVTTEVLLDDTKFENFKERVRGRQKGEPIFANGAGAIQWQDMQIDLDKAALDKVNEINRQILMAVSGTSKTTLGLEESGTTRDTSKTQDENFTVDAVVPRAEDIADALNLDYRKHYDEWDENEFEIVVDSPVEKDREAELKDIEIRDAAYDLAEKLINAGYDREASFKYANGDISWEELGEPEEKEIPEALKPYAETDTTKKPEEQTDKEAEDEGATKKEEDTDEPEKTNSPTAKKIEENALVKAENQISARDYPDLYKDIDIDTEDLGCIMLDLEPMEVISNLPEGSEEDLFENPKWEQGSLPAETVPHVTLLYGLLENGNKWKNKVDLLLKDWKLDSVKIDHVGFFDTPDSYAVIAHLEKTPELVDGHERLTLLPHINTFSEYLPHMTLAYVKKEADVDKWVESLDKVYAGKTVKAAGINYGDPEEDDDDDSDNKTKNHVEDEHDMSKNVKLSAKDVRDKLSKAKKEKQGLTDLPEISDEEMIEAGFIQLPSGEWVQGPDYKEPELQPLETALARIGHDHNSTSQAGLIVAYNALEADTRDIVKAQENKLRDGVANIERDMVEASVNRVSKNFLDENSDVITETEQANFEKELMALLIAFYINLFPIFGRQLMAQRSTEYGVVVPYEVTKEAQKYIEKMAEKTAQSHIATVTTDILRAAQLAYYDATMDNLVAKVQAELAAGNTNIQKLLPANPTAVQIRRAAEAGKFDSLSIYADAQRLARQGAGRAEIVRSIRNKYQQISKNRATTIARTEAARVFNQSQYEADRQFLINSGLMSKAYKQLRSRTGTPCEYCQMLINMPPIPFEKNFADLGTHLTVTETNDNGDVKVKKLPINWEPVSAGNVHPNCSCEYVLIVRN